jgi:Family of unknown function (DUF5996)
MPATVSPGGSTKPWPLLDYSGWAGTCATLQLWTQVVGKVQLALAPFVNHWWAVAFHMTARGLTTGALPWQGGVLQIDFDFIDHQLILRLSDGRNDRIALTPQSVADFYAEMMQRLRALGVDVHIWTMPVEIPDAIPFDADHDHKSYDATAANLFWRQLVQVERVFSVFRARFLGKSSPAHFFWGSFDLAVTRFSGRTAPPIQRTAPNVALWVMQEGYSHELSSAGFWPGNGGYGKAAFYCYAYPEPEGFAQTPVKGASYDSTLGEFVLPYDAVAQSASPDDTLLNFLQATYAAAADHGKWDRAALERSGASK